ncbi:galactosyltransferase Lgt5 [Devosia insulae]|uniref:galactosyltransferase Lgt5 n=1 Tax=Devosia insulae TaxID=408174 RepID=UPI00114D1239|nr:galactosyltransferase Lgt5 [Devosia insulae]
MLPVVNAFWTGPSLGQIHAACLASFLTVGHRVVLHAYDVPSDIPAGVQLSDANALLPRIALAEYDRPGRYALMSDLIRFRILAAGLGLYVDCDCYCVRPIEDADVIVGWEADGIANGAVLKLPQNSPVLADLLAIGRGFVPPWFSTRRRLLNSLRGLLGFPKPLHAMPWGTVGPAAVSYYIKHHGLDGLVRPRDEFYPLAYDEVERLYDPALSIDDLITPLTKVIHLYNEMLGKMRVDVPHPASPLGRMIAAVGA